MAYSLSGSIKTVHGNERVYHGVVTADAASGAVVIPGMTIIDVVHLTAKTSAVGLATITKNATTSEAASNGSVNIKSATSGDEYYITVYGR